MHSHSHLAYMQFCCQDLFSAHYQSSMRGFHCRLQSVVGARCCLSSTHQSPRLDLATPLSAYTMHLDAPNNKTNY